MTDSTPTPPDPHSDELQAAIEAAVFAVVEHLYATSRVDAIQDAQQFSGILHTHCAPLFSALTAENERLRERLVLDVAAALETSGSELAAKLESAQRERDGYRKALERIETRIGVWERTHRTPQRPLALSFIKQLREEARAALGQEGAG